MTSDEIKTVRHKGVTCRTDMGLCLDRGHKENHLYLVSVYGATQQVKAVASAIASSNAVFMEGVFLYKSQGSCVRFKINSIGDGKSHGIVWIDELKSHVIWTEPSEEMKALDAALSRRRIPYDREWLLDIRDLLIENSYLTRLEGWGGLQGYHALWDDDAICDLVAGSCCDFRTGKEVK